MTDEDKKRITDYLNDNTPKGAGIVVVVITSEGATTFTNLSMPDPNENPTADN